MSEVVTTRAGGTWRGDRTLCSVVGCKRSTKGRFNWWFCAEHWRMVPMWARRRLTKLKRTLRRRGWVESDQRAWWVTNGRAQRLVEATGRFLVRAANRRASGL